MEHLVDVPLVPPVASHGHPTAEQLDGVVGAAQVSDVWNGLCGSQRVRGVVRK